MLLRLCTADRVRFVLSVKSLAEFKEKVKSRLSVSHFTVVVEDDGSSVCDEVLAGIIEEGESLGTLMILKNSENWTHGLC